MHRPLFPRAAIFQRRRRCVRSQDQTRLCAMHVSESIIPLRVSQVSGDRKQKLLLLPLRFCGAENFRPWLFLFMIHSFLALILKK